MNNSTETIKEIIEKLLEIMGFSAIVEMKNKEPENIVANIVSSEASYLIGHKGSNLYALQHLARLAVSRKLGENYKDFILDVNGYRKDRAEIIKELALSKAEQATREKRDIIFQPMSPYERRIVHVVLADNRNIICESEGEGEERHIVIKPAA